MNLASRPVIYGRPPNIALHRQRLAPRARKAQRHVAVQDVFFRIEFQHEPPIKLFIGSELQFIPPTKSSDNFPARNQRAVVLYERSPVGSNSHGQVRSDANASRCIQFVTGIEQSQHLHRETLRMRPIVGVIHRHEVAACTF